MEPIKEKISLELDASGIKGNSLSALITQLEQVEAHVQKINTALNGVKLGPAAARSVKELEAEIQRLQSKAGTSLQAADLSKGLGLDQKEFERFLARNKRNLDQYQSQLENFRSSSAAAKAVARFEREGAAGRARLGDLLRPTVAGVHGQASAGVSGKVTLEIPAAQVQASVVGPIALTIPGSQVSGGGPGGRNAETGQFTGGSGKKVAKGPLQVGGAKGELQRVRVETEKYLRETIMAVDEAGQIVSTVHDSMEGIVKTSTKTTVGTRPLEQFREARRAAEENFKQLKAAINPNDPGIGLAALQKKQAEQLRALLQAPFMGQLGAPQQASITKQVEERARTLEARSMETFQKAYDWKNYGMDAARTRLGAGPAQPLLPPFGSGFFTSGAKGRVGYSSPIGPRQRMRIQLPAPQPPIIPVASMGYASPIGPPAPSWAKPPPTPTSPFARGLKSFTPVGFAANLLNVSGWAAAVGVLYKSMQLANYSLTRFIDIGQQTARLSVVFRGVGGSAKDLTDDVLQLAAANGRETEEAMQSATEWSRLGLTRKEVNDATRVSLEAANVAHMHAGETTKQLASLMHIYNLEAGDLDGVLGMLTTTSQRYNVTLEDLFQGLDRSAGSAKLAKVGLAELQGLIGTVVGKTGQSGTVVGNTLKSLLVQFSNPDVQQYLRRFGIETLDKHLNQKGGSQILQEMFVKWQTMDDRQKQSMTWRLVGRQSAARFVPVMDDYVQSQKMAIESQLNLNAAQQANSTILGTLKSQLAGLRAEWDRLVVSQGGAGMGGSPMAVATGAVQTGKNLLRLFNRTGVSLSSLATGIPGAPILLPGMGTLMNRFNQRMEASDPHEQANRAALDFEGKFQQLGAQSGALAMRGRLLETIASALPNAKGDSLRSMVDVASSQMSGGSALRTMISGGNIAGAQELLRAASKRAQEESLQRSGEALSAKTGRLANLNLSLQDLNAEVAAMQKRGASQSDLNRKLEEQKELQAAIQELESNRSQAADDYAREAAEVSDVVELKQQYLNLLKEEEMVLQGIQQLSEQQTLGTAGGRLDAQVDSLTTSIGLLKVQKEALDERGGSEDTQAAEDLRKQIADLEARKAALQSPQVQDLTRTFDNRQIASRRAREEADSFAVGYTEAEKLLNQQRELRRTIGRIEGQPFRSDNDRVRIKEFEIALWQNQEKIQTRIVDLARQEKQIRIDATREFQRNLLLAGPGEQLQRLYASSLASRNLGSGEFNALSPELKRMIYELRGGEAGAKTREERGLLAGSGQTVEQEQAAYGRARAGVAFSGGILDRNSGSRVQGMPAMPLPPLDPVVTSARATAEQLTLLSGSATRATKALELLPQTITDLAKQAIKNALPEPTPTPKLGLHGGFSLGGK